MVKSTHHSILRFGVQLILTLALALSAQDAPAKQKHHTETKRAVAAAPMTDTEMALRAATGKEWDKSVQYARRSGDAVLMKLVVWMYLQDADDRATFQEITQFINDSPRWPQQQKLRLRAEQSLRWSEVPDAQLAAWFAANPPVSGLGKIKQAEMLLRQGASLSDNKIRTLIRDAWVGGDFEEEEATRLLTVYGDILQPQDHIARADRLLWEGKALQARWMLSLLPEDYAALMRARIALQEDSYDTDFYLSHVPSALLGDAGLIFERVKWRARKGDKAGAMALLLSAPVPVPHPDKWWKLRDLYIRDAIGAHDYRLARRLLVGHGLIDGPDYADAAWVSGWLSLRFLDDPRDAYLQFYNMFNMVKYAVSKARAAYWAGRAADAAGDGTAAHGWYLTAEAYPTTFYGQLAFSKLHPGEPLRLPAEPMVTQEDKEQFAANDLARAVSLATRARELGLATSLVHHLVEDAPTAAQAALAAALGNDIHNAMLSVRAAKRASQRGITLVRAGFPVYRLPQLPIEPAFALAISRQESEFDPGARSKSGAVGMMQILPKTAREMARKAGMAFSESRLYEPSYNIQLGSAYLSHMVKNYNGSYVLAAAAYNAGPGNLRDWMGIFGTPRGGTEQAVDWIEEIPFAETRNYVQRVIENLQVYRRLLGYANPPPLTIERDISRVM